MIHLRKLLLTLVFLFASIFILNAIAVDPPPPPGGGHGGGGNQPPAGAPIDGGLGILMALGAGYGSFKLYRSRKVEKKAANQSIAEVT